MRGLACTGAFGVACSATFSTGTSVTLTAAPATGSTFAGWGGACTGVGSCTVPLASARLVVATFTVPPPLVTEYYHLDALGSVRAVTNAGGTVLRTHDYHPFGEGVGVAAGTNPARFTGKPRDVETGLDYFGARYYAQGTGRFTTVDPVLEVEQGLVDTQRWNRYSYVSNRPTSRVDPDGRYEIDVHRHLTAALARAAGMSPSVASAIATATQGVDDSKLTSPFWAPWNLDENHFTSEDVRKSLWEQFERTGSTADLGVFLHAHQDSYSHAGYYPIPGHAWDGHVPDKTYTRPELADRMAASTFQRLQQATSRLTGRPVGVSWQDIEKFVQRFNRANNMADKIGILNELLRFIDGAGTQPRK